MDFGVIDRGSDRLDMATNELRVSDSLDEWRDQLLSQRNSAGYWEGQLSPSALSTATAVSALAVVLRETKRSGPTPARWLELVAGGATYLAANQNADGGFGDTDRSYSNIATTYLAVAAWRLAGQVLPEERLPTEHATALIERAEAYLAKAGGVEGLRQRYGSDKTFVVPIMTNCAIAGMFDWGQVPRLPFEAAVFPQSMYRFLQMPVVSYAIPALVAIGQARHFLGPPALAPVRWLRGASVARTMRVLRAMQPESGGYLEATPLTSFVLMSLAVTGRGDVDVAIDCIRFLSDSVLPDGSWPIDTNLATWVTSLSMIALCPSQAEESSASTGGSIPAVGSSSGSDSESPSQATPSQPLSSADWCTESLLRWHLSCQHTERHPFTGANPGGWGWSDLSGAVPDGDDTPAAILALASCRQHFSAAQWMSGDLDVAFRAARNWLLQLQNRDGGWPTFCRGWGKLPFDRSSVDLTAHAIRALHVAAGGQPDATDRRAMERGFAFLDRQQQADGCWCPLWFGNQDLPDDENPYYGTGRVLLAYADVGQANDPRATSACRFLLDHQSPDGGWGGGPSLTRWLSRQGKPTTNLAGETVTSSVEETAVVTEALAAILYKLRNSASETGFQGDAIPVSRDTATENVDKIEQALCVAMMRGADFLVEAATSGRNREPWPIGFYFAKLWYHENLYPAVFATAALSRVLKLLRADDTVTHASRPVDRTH